MNLKMQHHHHHHHHHHNNNNNNGGEKNSNAFQFATAQLGLYVKKTMVQVQPLVEWQLRK